MSFILLQILQKCTLTRGGGKKSQLISKVAEYINIMVIYGVDPPPWAELESAPLLLEGRETNTDTPVLRSSQFPSFCLAYCNDCPSS